MLDISRQVYTTEEVARMVRISTEKIRRMVRAGILRPVPNLGVWRFTRREIERVFGI